MIPDPVETIGNYAFANCQTLKDIVLPEDLETIGPNTFDGVPAAADDDWPDLSDLVEE